MMIRFKQFDVGDIDYEEQIEQFQKEHPSAEFVQITGGHTTYEKIWFKYDDSIEQTELNDNQQKYLEQLKRAYRKFGNVYDGIFFSLFDLKKRWGLPAEKFFQVLDILKVWVLEQEEK
ncbi:hypothetical protein D924_02592 [Enterococcus faecalis 06-MB-S-10]|nr:hypothetical protein D924_02592 [Enterococcus faecalis 06-MB-S-10]EPH85864.1 hypothetical protein D923_03006 [Enterococcus faecalis 06-MB-S-04]